MASVFLLLPLLFLSVYSQNISTTTPVPPLQWINLSNLLQGSSRPPPLKDAAIGYDETSRSLIIFGGLSESGFPQSQTFLLNLETLTWSIPSPPDNLRRSPPSRSAVISGGDFAASNRHGFVVIGGKGSDGKALSDIWEYDFNNQFWSEVALSPGGPSPRWGAAGGIDIRVAPTQDPVVPGPNNTFYLAGGFDGTNVSPLSDIWSLKIGGTLSSNLPDSVTASWDQLSIGKFPGRVEQGGTVIAQQIIASGGCASAASLMITNTTCGTQESFILDVQRQLAISPGSCPAPRVGPVMVPNLNGFFTGFASQAFLLLGTFNTTLWNDSNGLAQGEAILDTATGTWTRVLPAGDPDSSGTGHFPIAREGAAAISFTQALVGASRTISSDTIVFGGQDANGNFLSDIWLLRAYTGVVSPSNPTWSGFGNGQLQTGVNADGSGVRIQYVTECAKFTPPAVSSKPSGTTSSGSAQPTPTSIPKPTPSHPAQVLNTSLFHKILLPVSIVALLPIILFFRWVSAAFEEQWLPKQRIFPLTVAVILGVAAYAVGLVGFVIAFPTISSSTASTSSLHLKTAHSIAGVVFFLCLYAVVPALFLVLSLAAQRSRIRMHGGSQSQIGENVRPDSRSTTEKVDPAVSPGRSATPSILSASPPTSPPSRQRTLSFDASYLLRPSTEGGLSSDSSPAPTPRGFEVVNRPKRPRKLSSPWPQSTAPEAARRSLPTSRSLGEVDWLLRRRSLNAVGELDYVLTQAHNAHVASLAEKADPESPAHRFIVTRYPNRRVAALHILTQVSIVGLSAVTLAELWERAPRFYFVIFLACLVVFYASMLALAWKARPTTSILTTTLLRLRGKGTAPSNSPSDGMAITPQNPYTHHRPSFRASTHDELSYGHSRPLSEELGDDGDDLDDDTRQRLIEEEMGRRDVSIVTVPRRKLQVANPS